MTRYYYDTTTLQGANAALDYSRLYGEVWPLVDDINLPFRFVPNQGWICNLFGDYWSLQQRTRPKLYLPPGAVEALLNEEHGEWLWTEHGNDKWSWVDCMRFGVAPHPTTDKTHPMYSQLLKMPAVPMKEE